MTLSAWIHLAGLVLLYCTMSCSECAPIEPHTQGDLDTVSLHELVDESFESNLPIIVVDTLGKTIVNEPKIPARMRIVDTPDGVNKLSMAGLAEEFSIGIEHRGDASLAFSKKQFSIELRDDTSKERHVSLLGLSKDADWVLYGPYSDKTLMRNHISYWISNEIGFQAPRTRYVEVFLNEESNPHLPDQYWGIYLLTEKNNRGKQRVDITRLRPTELSPEEISGGYIVNMDRPGDGSDCIYHPVKNKRKPCFRLKYPKIDKVAPEQRQWFVDYFKKFEKALKKKADYRPYIDFESFVNGFIISELVKNPDGFRLSTYFYKDRNNPLVLGPLWDCNLGMGNVDHSTKKQPRGWIFLRIEKDKAATLPFWWRALLDDKAFVDRIIARWRELRCSRTLTKEKIVSKIKETERLLDQSHRRNFKRWPILGIKVMFNPRPLPNSWHKEVDMLKKWTAVRIRWMDENIHNFNKT